MFSYQRLPTLCALFFLKNKAPWRWIFYRHKIFLVCTKFSRTQTHTLKEKTTTSVMVKKKITKRTHTSTHRFTLIIYHHYTFSRAHQYNEKSNKNEKKNPIRVCECYIQNLSVCVKFSMCVCGLCETNGWWKSAEKIQKAWDTLNITTRNK